MPGSLVTTGTTAKGYQQVVSLSAAATLTVPTGTARAIIQCSTQPVRWRDDGTNPTATVGMRLVPGDVLLYDGDKLGVIAFIEESASAKLDIYYMG